MEVIKLNTQFKQRICLNGHQITDRATWNDTTNEFCEKCGAKVIDSCPDCKNQINGYLKIDGVFDISTYTVPVPKYCKKCGNPYPWTKAALEALDEIVELSELSEKDKQTLKDSSLDLISNTPKSKVAALKWKTFGNSLLGIAHDVLVDVASESIVKLIYGG